MLYSILIAILLAVNVAYAEPVALQPLNALSQPEGKARQKAINALPENMRKGLTEGFAAVTASKKNTLAPHYQTLAENIATQSKEIVKQQFNNAYHAMRGTKEKHAGKLYIFISFSMPDSLIKQYLLDATWTDATLVLRGIAKGMTLGQFVRSKIVPLVKFKGQAAAIQINPNLFEKYQVTSVPTIVYTDDKHQEGCLFELKPLAHSSLTYKSCRAADPKHYWSMQGQVSTLWALSQFESVGAPVRHFIARMDGLSKNIAVEGKHHAEPLFKGDWENAPLPYPTGFVAKLLSHKGLASYGSYVGPMDVIEKIKRNPEWQTRLNNQLGGHA